nr:hypothetical protein [Morchella crassipes]
MVELLSWHTACRPRLVGKLITFDSSSLCFLKYTFCLASSRRSRPFCFMFMVLWLLPLIRFPTIALLSVHFLTPPPPSPQRPPHPGGPLPPLSWGPPPHSHQRLSLRRRRDASPPPSSPSFNFLLFNF